MTPTRYDVNSPAARIGRAILAVILLAIVGGAAWWPGALTWPHWWFWPIELVLGLIGLLVVVPTAATVVRPVPEKRP